MITLTSSLTELSKNKTANAGIKALAKLEIKTVKDLLFYFPTRYLDFSKFSNISEVKAGEVVTIKGNSTMKELTKEQEEVIRQVCRSFSKTYQQFEEMVSDCYLVVITRFRDRGEIRVMGESSFIAFVSCRHRMSGVCSAMNF
jgi:RecG-like helicase